MAKANLKDAPTPKGAVMPADLAVETLIDKGKKQGFLRPTDILACFPHVELDPDQLFRIFNVFRDMGIEITDGEVAPPVEKPQTVRVVGILRPTAEQAVAIAKAIKAGDHDTWKRILAAARVEEVDEILDLTEGWPERLEMRHGQG